MKQKTKMDNVAIKNTGKMVCIYYYTYHTIFFIAQNYCYQQGVTNLPQHNFQCLEIPIFLDTIWKIPTFFCEF